MGGAMATPRRNSGRERMYRAGQGWARAAAFVRRNSFVGHALLAVAAVALVVLALMPLASVVVEGWSRHDIELRSRLLFRSVRDQVAAGITANVDLVPFFERLTEDERILALGFCSEAGRLQHGTRMFPASVSCKEVPLKKADTFTMVPAGRQRIHISAFPLAAGGVSGHLLVLHDLTYVFGRVREARFYTAIALIGLAVGLGVFATSIVLALRRG